MGDIEGLVCELYPLDYQDRVFKDIRISLEKYPYLVVEQSETFSYTLGNTEKALSLLGPISVNHAGSTFFIPIDVFIPTLYPSIAPICYIRPAKGTSLVKSHKFMNSEGLCSTPLIQNWNPSSVIVQIIDSLVSIFSIEPPVIEAPITIQTYNPLNSQSNNNKQDIKPSIIFDDTNNNNSNPPSYYQASQNSKLSQLQQKLKDQYNKYSIEVNNKIDNILKDGETLQKHSFRLDNHISALEHDINQQNKCIQVFKEKTENLKQWINYESESQKTRTVHDIIKINSSDIQLFDTIAEDAAYEDCLFELRQQLHNNKIDFDNFTKLLRTTARKQFFARALANKIVDINK